MPVQSKIAQQASTVNTLQTLLLGSNKRKLVSATILLIIAFLVHIKNKRPEVDSLRYSRLEGENKKK